MPLKPTTQAWQSNLGQSVADLISGWRPEQEDRSQVVQDWSNLFAAPAMQAWSKFIAPYIKESFNLPGSLYARSTGQGVARQAQDFFTGSVQPTLLQMLESSKSRNLQSLDVWSRILGTGAGLSTAQTLQYAQKPTWRQDFASLMSGLESGVNAGVGTVGAIA